MSEQTKTIFEATSSPMHGEESLKGFDVLSLPTQSRRVTLEIDLINQRQVLVAFGVLDLVDADGIDLAERPVLQPEGDDVFDRVEDLVPGSAKRLGRFFP